jgi:hypothetical protein
VSGVKPLSMRSEVGPCGSPERQCSWLSRNDLLAHDGALVATAGHALDGTLIAAARHALDSALVSASGHGLLDGALVASAGHGFHDGALVSSSRHFDRFVGGLVV